MPTTLRRTIWSALLILACGLAAAHEVPIDWAPESMPPGGSATAAEHSVAFDAATGSYLLTARDDRGTVAYRVHPGEGSGANGLFSVDCALDGGEWFTITGGVMLSARGPDGREIAHDGTIRIGAMDELDLTQDGPGGYMAEPTGHGPCLRLGDTLPIAPHTTGFVTYPLGVPAGAYRIGVRYMDDADDRADDAHITLSVDGSRIGKLTLSRDDDRWYEELFEAQVAEGSVLRIDARSDDSNGVGADFCRISHLLVRPLADRGLAVSHERTAGGVAIVQQRGLEQGVPPVRAELALQGRTLRCALRQVGAATPPAGLTGLSLLPTDGTPDARILTVPYVDERVIVNGGRGLISTCVDRFRSHCTRLRTRGVVDEQTGRCEAFGELVYQANSAGEYYDFSEALYLTASPRLLDVTPTFPARTPSAGRAQLGRRVVFDHWRMAPGDGLERQMRLMDGCGMHELLAILHTWMHYGYDRRQPQFTPANPDLWTPEQFTSAIAACREMGWRVAVHENYQHMDWDSPYNSPTPAREFGEPDRPGDPGPAEAMGLVASSPGEDLSRQPRNAWAFARLADLRVGPGPLTRPQPPAFPISSDKTLFYSQIESHKIRDLYGTTAGYLDVTPCTQPGVGTWDIHIDLDARNREARGFDQAYRNAARLFAHHRDLFEISTGEGGAYAGYHAGYIHAVERQVRTRMLTPIIPHFELTAIRPLSLHHGMGYYTRFFDRDSDSSTWDWDLYRAMQIAFGHAGFLGDHLFRGPIPTAEAVRHYYTMRALQEVYADAELLDVQYDAGDEWIGVEEGLARGYDFVQARIRLRYSGGLEVACNFDREEDWQVSVAGRQFALPPLGYAAVCDARELVVYSALVNGGREDYAACPEYEYRHARPDGQHVVSRATGLPGLSERETPGMLVYPGEQGRELAVSVPGRLSPGGRLNLTVMNVGDELTTPVRIEGLAAAGPIPAITLRSSPRGTVRKTAEWTPPAAGEWTMALACTYTDPGHMDEAGRVAVLLPLEGPPLTVAADAPEQAQTVSATGRQRGNFIEIAAELTYPAQAGAGMPLELRFTTLQFGETTDDDFARDVRLVLTNAAVGATVEVAFAELGSIERTTVAGFAEPYVFPGMSVTTFELG